MQMMLFTKDNQILLWTCLKRAFICQDGRKWVLEKDFNMRSDNFHKPLIKFLKSQIGLPGQDGFHKQRKARHAKEDMFV